MTLRKAVFLDRDGTLNEAIVHNGLPFPPRLIGEFRYVDKAHEALLLLKRIEFVLIVVTNQPDVITGKTTREFVEKLHNQLKIDLEIDDIYCCYELEEENSGRYKPAPGMLLEAAKKWKLDLEGSYMIGDRWRDVGAGKNAGCHTILIEKNYLEQKWIEPDTVVSSLFDAVALILRNEKENSQKHIKESGSC